MALGEVCLTEAARPRDCDFPQSIRDHTRTRSMTLPRRVAQHKAQSDSFAILLYRLRDLGIFRNVTENDYGIDFEIEMVRDEMVLGRFLKVQVKSSKKPQRTGNGDLIIKDIKQSTLGYWREITSHINMVAFAVDLQDESIYYTTSLAEQAREKFSTDKGTGFIALQNRIGKDEDLRGHLDALVAAAFRPSISTVTAYHRIALTELPRFIEMLSYAHWSPDHGSPWNDIGTFKLLLDVSRVLIGTDAIRERAERDGYDASKFFDFPYWQERSRTDGYDDFSPAHATLSKPVKFLFPELINRLIDLQRFVQNSETFWRTADEEYLKAAYFTKIPTEVAIESLRQLTQQDLYAPSPTEYYNLIRRIDGETLLKQVIYEPRKRDPAQEPDVDIAEIRFL